MIGDVVNNIADVAAEDFQMNLERFGAVDFTHYFTNQPYALMLRQPSYTTVKVKLFTVDLNAYRLKCICFMIINNYNN